MWFDYGDINYYILLYIHHSYIKNRSKKIALIMNISFMLSIHIFTAGLLQALSNGVSESVVSFVREENIMCLQISAIKHQINLLMLNSLFKKLIYLKCYIYCLNHLIAKSFNLNFHPLEVVSRWRDPQIQVSKNYSDLTKWRSTLFKYCWLMSHLSNI